MDYHVICLLNCFVLFSFCFQLLPCSMFSHSMFHGDFDGIENFSGMEHEDPMIPMDSFWSPENQNYHPTMMMMNEPSMDDFYSTLLGNADLGMSDHQMSYSESNGLGYGYLPRGSNGMTSMTSDIPEDIIDGIVAKVLVDDNLNSLFNSPVQGYKRRNRGRKHNNRGYRSSDQRSKGRRSSLEIKPSKPLEHGIQNLSRYVKALKQVNWDDEKVDKEPHIGGQNGQGEHGRQHEHMKQEGQKGQGGYGGQREQGGHGGHGGHGEQGRQGGQGGQREYGSSKADSSNFGPIFKTEYKKDNGNYNVYSFLVPMGKTGLLGKQSIYRKPCHKS